MSTGPMQGVHPNPNATPATGAAKRPNRDRSGWKRFSPYSHGACTNSEPSTNNAMARTTSPEIRVMTAWLSNNVEPTAVAVRPRSTNTAENPATNSPVSRATRPRLPRDSVIWPTSRPVTIDRYAGTIGNTHGDRNDTTPAPEGRQVGDRPGAHRTRRRCRVIAPRSSLDGGCTSVVDGTACTRVEGQGHRRPRCPRTRSGRRSCVLVIDLEAARTLYGPRKAPSPEKGSRYERGDQVSFRVGVSGAAPAFASAAGRIRAQV